MNWKRSSSMKKSFKTRIVLVCFFVLIVSVTVYVVSQSSIPSHKPMGHQLPIHIAAATCVILFEHVQFKGQFITICANDHSLLNDKNNHLSFGNKNWNDVASSAVVSKFGKGVVLYQDIHFKGHKWFLKPGTKIADFTKCKLGQKTWNDVVSSILVK